MLQDIVDGDEYEENGLVKYKAHTDTLRNDNDEVIATTSTEPDASLPTAKNENLGKTYCDNKVTVRFKDITKTFTKADFTSYIDAELAKNSILEDITLEEYKDGALKLFANICTPHSEEQASISVSIASNGTVTMKIWDENDIINEEEDDFSEEGE